MPYTNETLSHGSVRFATYPIDQWHLFLLPWNGGGLTLLAPSGLWRAHKIQFGDFPAMLIDIRDCSIEGVPHSNMAANPGPVYNAYVRDTGDANGTLEFDFSQVRETISNGFITKQGDARWMLIGRVGCLPYGGGIGFPGGPTCGMCASFFQPERMSLYTKVPPGAGNGGVISAWVEMLPFQNQLHFVCFGDGREPNIEFTGLVANTVASYNAYCGISSRDADPPWDLIGGGTSNFPSAPCQAVCKIPGAGMGDGVELYQRLGVKIRVEGGAGSLPLGGLLTADILM